MKKLLSVALTLAMALSLSVNAFADTTTITPDADNDYKPTPESGAITVNYTSTPTYTVTIPGSVTLDGNPATVSANNVKLEKNKQLGVKLSGINVTPENPDGDDKFTVSTPQGASLEYTVQIPPVKETVPFEKGDTILTVNTAEKNSDKATLYFKLKDAIKFAGDYTGTVTFTVSIEDAPTTGD